MGIENNWHTPHRDEDVAQMNDAHRHFLARGKHLDSGWLSFGANPPEPKLRHSVMRALADIDDEALRRSDDHGAGEFFCKGHPWRWYFAYYEDFSLAKIGDPRNEQVYRVLCVYRPDAEEE